MGPSFTIVNHKHNYANVNLKFYPVRIKFNLNRRLNSITNAHDAVANNVIYHDVCWVKAKRDADPKTIAI